MATSPRQDHGRQIGDGRLGSILRPALRREALLEVSRCWFALPGVPRSRGRSDRRPVQGHEWTCS
eukprot:2546399-Pyramimonas_sp.AAC.1